MRDCRFCGTSLKYLFADLGMSPLANSYLQENQLRQMEAFYPLHTYVCDRCFLVQLDTFEAPDNIFTDYAYFSSFSSSWLKHCRDYVDAVIGRFRLDDSSLVVEIGSNDGYLLQYFVERNIPVLGIDPAKNIAPVAEERGVPTLVEFFNSERARDLVLTGKNADIIIGNNVLAQIPDLNDFIFGMKELLKRDGIITMEFPHLMKLIEHNQFDTIYHEHFSYFSLTTAIKIFHKQGLSIFDVEELPTHGGSLRIYATHEGSTKHKATGRLEDLKYREEQFGLGDVETYLRFNESVKRIKRNIWEFIITVKNSDRKMAGYGAPAKGNTLLNFCGIGNDVLEYTVDISPYKQGLYLPGTHIPIYHPEKLKETKPDYILILSWNLKEEITEQISFVHEWKGRFVIPIPELRIYKDARWQYFSTADI